MRTRASPPARRANDCRLSGILAAAAVLAGCATHPAPPISAATIAAARTFKEYTVYWAGTEVDGIPLTQVDTPRSFYAPVGFTAYYGNCEGRGALHDEGCNLPLKISTSVYSPHSDAAFGPQHWLKLHGVPAVVYHGGDDIEIYTDRMDIDISADSPVRAQDAAKALELFNRAASPGFPAFPQPVYTPNLSPSTAQRAAGRQRRDRRHRCDERRRSAGGARAGAGVDPQLVAPGELLPSCWLGSSLRPGGAGVASPELTREESRCLPRPRSHATSARGGVLRLASGWVRYPCEFRPELRGERRVG